MGLTGEQLDAQFGEGFSPVKSVKGINQAALNMPSSPILHPEGDVQEQQVQASITFSADTGELKIVSAAAGEGLWIPYLGNGKGKEGDRGWGTYSKIVNDATWVATGPFSGCYVAAFQGAGFRFAHLITKAAGHPCETVDNQIAAITAASGAVLYGKWSMQGLQGLGVAFFMKVNGFWRRRSVWVLPDGSVVQINSKSTAL
jgi:hypothetical protein